MIQLLLNCLLLAIGLSMTGVIVFFVVSLGGTMWSRLIVWCTQTVKYLKLLLRVSGQIRAEGRRKKRARADAEELKKITPES
jgi:uncharacterized protein (DUF983 family)